MASPGTPRVLSRWHSSVYVSEGQAAVELFFRLNHARQTMDYVRHQVTLCPMLWSHAAMPCQACLSCPLRICWHSLWRYCTGQGLPGSAAHPLWCYGCV